MSQRITLVNFNPLEWHCFLTPCYQLTILLIGEVHGGMELFSFLQRLSGIRLFANAHFPRAAVFSLTVAASSLQPLHRIRCLHSDSRKSSKIVEVFGTVCLHLGKLCEQSKDCSTLG